MHMHHQCSLLNRRIDLASSIISQANYFERTDVALPGFAKYFRKSGHEELEHAEKLMSFQVQRGGVVKLNDIKKPAKDDWGGPLDAMEAALQLERDVNQALLDLHATADKNGDYQVLAGMYKTTCTIRRSQEMYKLAFKL